MSYTINPNAKNKWARNAENTMDLSIETDASSVYLDNGRTLEQEIGEGSMVSNVTTVDSAMSKVIDGTLDGAYESLVFKGKSLVNLLTSFRPDTDSAWVRNGSSFTLNASGVLFLNYTALLKPNTTYTVVGKLDFDVDGIVIGFREGNKAWEVNRRIGSRGRFAVLISTSAESTSNALTVHRAVTDNSDRVTLSNLMVLEGDWTNKELPPYFEGICDCKSPILSNVGGKDLNTSKSFPYQGTSVNLNINNIVAGKTYYIYVDVESYNDANLPVIGIVNKEGNNWNTKMVNIPLGKSWIKLTTSTTNTISNVLRLHKKDGLNDWIYVNNIMVFEEEDYKFNTLSLNQKDGKTIVLRSLPNGVCDTLNVETGEYVQRITQYTLTGNETNAWNISNNSSGELAYITVANIIPEVKGTEGLIGNLISDTFHNDNPYHVVRHERCIGAYQTHIRIKIPEIELSASSYKDYFRNNPTTIQYELATPITTIIEPLTIPFAYENGHIILESGFKGQSLLPTLEYSTVVNKTGLVESVAKTIQRQEKQLTMLEKMLIQNIINLDYNNTLLTLKNEMEEML